MNKAKNLGQILRDVQVSCNDNKHKFEDYERFAEAALVLCYKEAQKRGEYKRKVEQAETKQAKKELEGYELLEEAFIGEERYKNGKISEKKYDIEELKKQYPRAALFLKAEWYTDIMNEHNYKNVTIARTAREAIIDGWDSNQVQSIFDELANFDGKIKTSDSGYFVGYEEATQEMKMIKIKRNKK